MKEHKTKTYILYALGEIALVMIGILLALQVNNWNEERKNRQYELKMLAEVHTAVQTDIDILERDLTRIEQSERSAKILTRYKNGDMSRPDSILQHISRANIRRFFQANDGPYEAIKSGGLDRISNDSLRTMLSDVYDNVIPSVTYMYNEVLSDYIDANQQIVNDLFTGKMVVEEGGDLDLELLPPTWEQVQDPRFDLLLRNSHTIQIYGKRNLHYALDAFRELEKSLIAELKGAGEGN